MNQYLDDSQIPLPLDCYIQTSDRFDQRDADNLADGGRGFNNNNKTETKSRLAEGGQIAPIRHKTRARHSPLSARREKDLALHRAEKMAGSGVRRPFGRETFVERMWKFRGVIAVASVPVRYVPFSPQPLLPLPLVPFSSCFSFAPLPRPRTRAPLPPLDRFSSSLP